MTNTAKHTPTPWFTEHSGVQKIYAQGAGDIEHVFANCLMGDCKANAAFIVKAVNCHEQLVAFFMQAGEKGLFKYMNAPCVEAVKAALAAAEAQ